MNRFLTMIALLMMVSTLTCFSNICAEDTVSINSQNVSSGNHSSKAIMVASIINAVAVVAGVIGTVYFARKSVKIEQKEHSLRVTPVLEIYPLGGSQDGVGVISRPVKITNKGQLHTTIRKVEVEMVVAGYSSGITKSHSCEDILAVGDSIRIDTVFNSKDMLRACTPQGKGKENPSSDGIKFIWKVTCFGPDGMEHSFSKTSKSAV